MQGWWRRCGEIGRELMEMNVKETRGEAGRPTIQEAITEIQAEVDEG